MKASVKGNLKPKGKKEKKVMKHFPKERFPGVNGELYEIRIVDTGTIINAEINLLYTDAAEEKSARLRTDPYPLETPVEEIREKTKANIRGISIIKQETGVNLWVKEETPE